MTLLRAGSPRGFLLAYRRLVARSFVHAIEAEGDLPPEFAKDTEFNAVQAQQIKDSGGRRDHGQEGGITRAPGERENARLVINFNTLFRTYIYTSLRLSQSRV